MILYLCLCIRERICNKQKYHFKNSCEKKFTIPIFCFLVNGVCVCELSAVECVQLYYPYPPKSDYFYFKGKIIAKGEPD